ARFRRSSCSRACWPRPVRARRSSLPAARSRSKRRMARSGNAMGGLGKFTELRQRLLFVLGALLVYRVGSYIPVPGVNPDAMLALMEQQKGTIVDMFNMFSGGALSRFSLFALNVVP